MILSQNTASNQLLILEELIDDYSKADVRLNIIKNCSEFRDSSNEIAEIDDPIHSAVAFRHLG